MKVYLVDGWRTSVEYVIALPISLLSEKKLCGATYLGGITEAVRKAAVRPVCARWQNELRRL